MGFPVADLQKNGLLKEYKTVHLGGTRLLQNSEKPYIRL